jgi:hypothetical protein
MRIQSTAPDRKTLVKALAERLGQTAVYCGPPSFAYTIGGVTVDREGAIILPEGVDPDGVQSFLVSKGWLEAAPMVDSEIMTISVPAEGMTVKTMHNLILMLYSKQYLLGKALKEETIRIDDSVVERLQQTLPETPADFKALVYGLKVQGHIVGVDFANDAVALSFPLSDKQDVIHAYTLLTVNLIAAAKVATRVHPERQQPENEKYYMRGWLVRLGFGGKEAKGLRSILLKHLKGHSAFRTDEDAVRHQDKYSEKRRSLKENLTAEVQHDEV